MRLVTIDENNTTQLIPTKNCSTIDMISTSEDRTIIGVDNSGSEIDEVRIVNTNSIKVSKLAKSKDLK